MAWGCFESVRSVTLSLLLFVIWLHFVGDFIFQTDKMALNKSKSFEWLGLHALTYGLPLVLVGWKWAFVNACLHFVVDAVTSRINAKLWAAGQRHWFFVCIGADQAIHMSILIATLGWKV